MKRGSFTQRVKALYESGSKHKVMMECDPVMFWYGWQLCHHLHRVKGKGAPVSWSGITTFYTQQSSQKTNFITLSADVKPAGLNELFHSRGHSIWPAVCAQGCKCGILAEDSKGPHPSLLLRCPWRWLQKRHASSLFMSHVEPLPPCVWNMHSASQEINQTLYKWQFGRLLYMYPTSYENGQIKYANQGNIRKLFKFLIKEHLTSLSAVIATNSVNSRRS